MLAKKPRSSNIAGFLHKSFVTVCVGFTIVGTGALAFMAADLIFRVRPTRANDKKTEAAIESHNAIE